MFFVKIGAEPPTTSQKFAHSASTWDFCFNFILSGHLCHVNFDFNWCSVFTETCFSFGKGSNCQNHFSSGSLQLKKKSPPPPSVKFPIPHYRPKPSCYLENPIVKKHRKVDIKLFLYCPILVDFSILFQIFCPSLKFNKLLNKLVKIF